MKNGSLPIADVTHCMRLCTQQDYTFFADRQTQFLLDAGRKLDRYTSRVEDDHVTPRWGWLPMGAVRDTGLWFFFLPSLGHWTSCLSASYFCLFGILLIFWQLFYGEECCTSVIHSGRVSKKRVSSSSNGWGLQKWKGCLLFCPLCL